MPLHLSDKRRIVVLHLCGCSTRGIARYANVAAPTVQRAVATTDTQEHGGDAAFVHEFYDHSVQQAWAAIQKRTEDGASGRLGNAIRKSKAAPPRVSLARGFLDV